MTPRLVVTAGPDKGRSFPLTPGEILQVGRSQSTATRLTDPAASRVHCQIEWDGVHATLINSSAAGTLVNGHAASQIELKSGDVIRLGATELNFQTEASAETATVAPPAGRPTQSWPR